MNLQLITALATACLIAGSAASYAAESNADTASPAKADTAAAVVPNVERGY